jgi:SNF2 family DNA or RNA helicase
MLILHAGICAAEFAVWAEGGPLSEAGIRGRRRRITAWLPSVKGTPIPSSPLISETEPPSGEPQLAPRAVTAVFLDASAAIELLCGCVNRTVLSPGVIVGADLAYWSTAMRFAGGLVTRQQFLPSVVNKNGTFEARWEPVIAGQDTERLAKLAAAMPAAARALTAKPDAAPEEPAARVLSDFVFLVIDGLVRAMATRRVELREMESVHDQWLNALHSPNALLKGDPDQLAEFAAQVREWRRPLAVTARAPFRLCFRLEEPQDNDNPWSVRYLLQATRDPSLLIASQEAWKAKGKTKALLQQGDFNAREYLLLALGQASGICPRIESSLKQATPGGYETDAAGAHEFLTERAAALEQAGFGVMLPAWWTRKGTKLHLTARANVRSPQLQGATGLSLATVVDFNWEVALGEEKLSREELLALAELKTPLVKVRGQWVELTAEEIRAALEFWQQKAERKATVRDVIRMAVGGVKPPDGIELQGVNADGWIAELLAELEGRAAFEQLPPPERFAGTLRPYQVRGYSWLAFLRHWGLGACLADDMGLGKTIQTLALIERDWRQDGRRPVLLICPTSVVGNWQKEAERFTPELPIMVHHGAGRSRGEAFEKNSCSHAIVISSYALLQRDFEILKRVPWAGVVLDEAQNIKNPETKQARAARSLIADYRIALTGTPVENNVGDLWSIIEFLNPGFLGSQAEFKRTFFIPIQANRDPSASERLKRITGPFLLRRLKTDKAIIADLPEKMEMKVFCNLTREQASLYEAVVKEATNALESSEGIQRKGLVLATLSKLKQVCNHPAQFLGDNSAVPGRSGKVARLTEMLEEILEVGDRALIFSQFAEMGQMLRRYLEATFGREVLFLHGGVTKKQRDRMVQRFQEEEDAPRLFLLSLKAGGTGLNLTGANHVFHFDRWWNPAVENQATDRAFRIGQKKDVQVHKFLCVGTLEEKIDEMIARKQEIARAVVGAGEGWLTELSNQELKELFALRKDAVGE